MTDAFKPSTRRTPEPAPEPATDARAGSPITHLARALAERLGAPQAVGPDGDYDADAFLQAVLTAADHLQAVHDHLAARLDANDERERRLAEREAELLAHEKRLAAREHLEKRIAALPEIPAPVPPRRKGWLG